MYANSIANVQVYNCTRDDCRSCSCVLSLSSSFSVSHHPYTFSGRTQAHTSSSPIVRPVACARNYNRNTPTTGERAAHICRERHERRFFDVRCRLLKTMKHTRNCTTIIRRREYTKCLHTYTFTEIIILDKGQSLFHPRAAWSNVKTHPSSCITAATYAYNNDDNTSSQPVVHYFILLLPRDARFWSNYYVYNNILHFFFRTNTYVIGNNIP